MGTMWLPPLLLLLGTFPQPSFQSLKCLNDLINNVTCVWNSTAWKPNTACTLHGFYQHQHKECDLMPIISRDQKLQRCSLIFPNVEFGSFTRLSINVTCGNSSHSIAHIGDYKPTLHIKIHPPVLHTFTNANITWSPGTPISEYIFSYYFQLQFKRSGKCWETAESVDVRNMRTSVEISEEKLEKGVMYDFRVRALVDYEEFSGEWSDWSPVSSWRSTVGVSPIDPPASVALNYGIPGVVVLCLILFFIIKVHRGNWGLRLTPVPDPSKFFTVLKSVHNESSQKWLHPVFPTESYATPQHSEVISSVEISAFDEETRNESCSLSEFQGSGDQTSGIGYICSSHQSTCETEVCCVCVSCHSSEGSERGNSKEAWMAFQSGCSYEPLEQHCQPGQPNSNLMMEVQQPMDEEEEEDSPVEAPLPSNPSDVFPLPFPFGPPLSPNNLPGLFHFPSGLAGLDLHTALLAESSLLHIPPSSGGYVIITDTCDSC